MSPLGYLYMPSPSSGGAVFSDFFGLTGEYSSSVNSSQQSLHIHQSPNQRLQQRQQKQQGPHSQHLQKWHWQIKLMQDPMLNGRNIFKLLCLSYEIFSGAALYINGSCRSGRESAKKTRIYINLTPSRRGQMHAFHMNYYLDMHERLEKQQVVGEFITDTWGYVCPDTTKISIAWNPNNAPFAKVSINRAWDCIWTLWKGWWWREGEN